MQFRLVEGDDTFYYVPWFGALLPFEKIFVSISIILLRLYKILCHSLFHWHLTLVYYLI